MAGRKAAAAGAVLLAALIVTSSARAWVVGTPRTVTVHAGCEQDTEAVPIKYLGLRYIVHKNPKKSTYYPDVFDNGNYNYDVTGDGSSWNGTILAAPDPWNWQTTGDPWAAYSAYSSMYYFSDVLDDATNHCDGVGAASWPNLQDPATWEYPLACATPIKGLIQRFYDGPSITIDPDAADGTLYLLDSSVDSGFRTYVFRNCATAPGQAGCSQTTCVDLATTGASVNCDDPKLGRVRRYHGAGVAVNPGWGENTHRLFTSYIDANQRLMLVSLALDAGGNPTVRKWIIAEGVDPARGCVNNNLSECIPRCDTQNDLIKIFPRPALDFEVLADGNTYLYLTWQNGAVSPVRLTAWIYVFNISNPDILSPVRYHAFGPSSGSYIMPTVVSQLSGGAGVFFYSTVQGVCNAWVEGRLSTDQFATVSSLQISDTFPLSTPWLGEYIAATTNEGGVLFPVWIEVEPPDAKCPSRHYTIARGNTVDN